MEPNADPNTQHCKFMKSKKTILKTFEIPFPPRNQSRKIQSVCITKSTKLQSDKNFRMTIFTKKAKDNTYQTIWPENPKCEPKRTILYFVKVPYNFIKIRFAGSQDTNLSTALFKTLLCIPKKSRNYSI